MKAVKYRCKECGYSEPVRLGEFVFRWIFNAINAVFVVMGMVLLFVLIVAYTGNPMGPNSVHSRLGGLVYDLSAHKDDLEVRDFLIDEIPGLEECGGNEGCYASQVFIYMKGAKYYLSGAQTYNPMYTLQKQNVQCSNYAYTYCYALHQFDIPCQVRCANNHCWSIVDLKSEGMTFRVDLTVPVYELL